MRVWPAQEGQRFRHQLEQIRGPDSGWHEVWEDLTNRKEAIVHLFNPYSQLCQVNVLFNSNCDLSNVNLRNQVK